jgi:hypothetical protein
MPMPETAIDKNDRFVLGQYQVGLPGQPFVVQLESESAAM